MPSETQSDFKNEVQIQSKEKKKRRKEALHNLFHPINFVNCCEYSRMHETKLRIIKEIARYLIDEPIDNNLR